MQTVNKTQITPGDMVVIISDGGKSSQGKIVSQIACVRSVNTIGKQKYFDVWSPNISKSLRLKNILSTISVLETQITKIPD